MKLFPNGPTIGELDGFTRENDIFGYKDFGDRLTALQLNVSEPMVTVVDGPWGCGKSTFIKQWAGELRKKVFLL